MMNEAAFQGLVLFIILFNLVLSLATCYVMWVKVGGIFFSC